MKKVIIIAAIALGAVSCSKEKCVQCTERYTQVKGEFCGSKSDREAFERNLKLNEAVLNQKWDCQTLTIR